MSHRYTERNERRWCKLIVGTSKNRPNCRNSRTAKTKIL
nr:MAG TPA: hypothetical protein [Caudoviricetes sp.]